MTAPPPPAVVEQYRYVHGHAAQRLKERHGLTVGLLEFTRLCLELAERASNGIDALRPVAKAGRERYVIRVHIQGHNVPVIWCNSSKVIVTALSPNMRAQPPGQVKHNRREWQQIKRRRKNRAMHREAK